jgi:hypothetical protein
VPTIAHRTTTRTLILTAALFTLTAGCAIRPHGPRGPASAAIEAAVTIDLESERLPVLQRIAHRRDLSQNDQLYLVNGICHGGFGGDQADALIALIDNPVCTQQTREYIANKLRFVMFSSERRRVVEALIEEPDQPSSTPEPEGNPR